MKKSIHLIFALLMLIGAYSCTDDTIGSSIADTKSSIIEDSSFVITGHSVKNSKILSRTSSQLLGQVHSPGYGKLTSDVVTELMPANTLDTLGVAVDSIRSCRLMLRLATEGFTGDSNAPMRMEVYRLNKQLPSPLYSDFDPSGYYSKSDLMGTTTYSVKSSRAVDTLIGNKKVSYREIAIPLPTSYAKSIFNLYKSNREAFSDPTVFKQHFPGLYITNSYGEGHIMNYYNTELEVRFNKHYKNAKVDTVYKSVLQVYAASTPEVASNNNVKFEVADSVKQLIDAGEPIIMGPAGYEVKVKFPIQEIIDAYNRNTTNGLSLINALELYLPAEPVANKYGIAPPQYLLMVKEGKKEAFFTGDSLTNNSDSFYAIYDATKKQYAFKGLRNYVLNIINKQHGVATEDDKNMVLTPIDVTTYVANDGYGSTQKKTIITKVAPSVALPTAVKLKLNKAKIKVVYSKQSLF